MWKRYNSKKHFFYLVTTYCSYVRIIAVSPDCGLEDWIENLERKGVGVELVLVGKITKISDQIKNIKKYIFGALGSH